MATTPTTPKKYYRKQLVRDTNGVLKVVNIDAQSGQPITDTSGYVLDSQDFPQNFMNLTGATPLTTDEPAKSDPIPPQLGEGGGNSGGNHTSNEDSEQFWHDWENRPGASKGWGPGSLGLLKGSKSIMDAITPDGRDNGADWHGDSVNPAFNNGNVWSQYSAKPTDLMNGSSGAPNGDTVTRAKDFLRGVEGFKTNAYWDGNAYRVGYGSDTYTDPTTGKVSKVTKNTIINRPQAEADLQRRVTTEFMPSAKKAVGAGWNNLTVDAQAALISMTYNYGSLNSPALKGVLKAAKSGNVSALAEQIAAVSNTDATKAQGLSSRRLKEAALVKASVGKPTVLEAMNAGNMGRGIPAGGDVQTAGLTTPYGNPFSPLTASAGQDSPVSPALWGAMADLHKAVGSTPTPEFQASNPTPNVFNNNNEWANPTVSNQPRDVAMPAGARPSNPVEPGTFMPAIGPITVVPKIGTDTNPLMPVTSPVIQGNDGNMGRNTNFTSTANTDMKDPNSSFMGANPMEVDLNNPHVNQFLQTINDSLGNPSEMQTFGGHVFDDMGWHPNTQAYLGTGKDYTTSAGWGMLSYDAFNEQAQKYGLPDYSLESQKKAMWGIASDNYTAKTGGSLLADISTNNPQKISKALAVSSDVWSSLPGGNASKVGLNDAVHSYTSGVKSASSSIMDTVNPAFNNNNTWAQSSKIDNTPAPTPSTVFNQNAWAPSGETKSSPLTGVAGGATTGGSMNKVASGVPTPQGQYGSAKAETKGESTSTGITSGAGGVAGLGSSTKTTSPSTSVSKAGSSTTTTSKPTSTGITSGAGGAGGVTKTTSTGITSGAGGIIKK